MSCAMCGGSMRTARKNVRYDAVGLRDVLLRAVEIRRCRWCDEYELVLPDLDDLHRVIAHAIIGKRGRLAPAEIRFLRKHLGWSSASIATHLGVTPETMSRWETAAIPMGVTADRLLRLIVAYRDRPACFPLKMLRVVAWGDAKPARVRVDVENGQWRAYAA